MPLVLHAIILKKPFFKSKEQALSYAREHFNHEKTKNFVRETSTSFRVRVHPKQQFKKTSFVSNIINPSTTLVFGLPK